MSYLGREREGNEGAVVVAEGGDGVGGVEGGNGAESIVLSGLATVDLMVPSSPVILAPANSPVMGPTQPRPFLAPALNPALAPAANSPMITARTKPPDMHFYRDAQSAEEIVLAAIRMHQNPPCIFLKVDLKPQCFVVPPPLCQMTSLTQLSLTNTSISSIPPAFASLKSLIKLDLSFNQISGPFPAVLFQLHRLKKIVMRKNQIQSIGDEIRLLSRLEKLELDGNCIDTVSPEFGALTKLEKVTFGENHLSAFPIISSPRLRQLNLCKNSLKSLPESTAALVYLKKLNVSGNQIASVPGCLSKMRCLEKLDLRRNPLISLPPALVSAQRAQLKRLRHSIPNSVPGLPGLFISALCGAQNTAALRHLGITHVLSVAGPEIDVVRDHAMLAKGTPLPNYSSKHTVPPHAQLGLPPPTLAARVPTREEGEKLGAGWKGESQQGEPNEFCYLKLEVLDAPIQALGVYFAPAFAFIDQAIECLAEKKTKGGCLIHCRVGVSRSAAILTAYIMRTARIPLGQALALVQSERSVIAPNPGFLYQLRRLEVELGLADPNIPIPRFVPPPLELPYMPQHIYQY